MSAPALETSDRLHPDEQPLADYVPVSRLAVAALVLGLVSPLIFVSPLLVVVPLAAVVVAAIGLWQIGASGGQLKGHWPATIGLCLGSLFLGWGMTQQVSRQITLTDHAERLVADWLTLIKSGELQKADQFRRGASGRISDTKALVEYYKANPEATDGLQTFFANEPLKSFRAAGPQVDCRSHGIISSIKARDGEQLVVKYEFLSAEGIWRPMWITVGRTLEGTAQTVNWEIRMVEATPPHGMQ